MVPHKSPVGCRLEMLEGRRLMSALTPDEGFALGGQATLDVFGNMDAALVVTVQHDGKVLVGGRGRPVDGSRSDAGVILRLNPDGSRDASFGNDGVVVSQPLDTINALIVTADGQLLVGGDKSFHGSQPTIARYNADGSLDTTFGAGGSGFSRLDLGDWGDSFTRLAVAPDGKIVAISNANYRIGNSDQSDFGVVRFNADGTFDESFGNGGVVTTDFSDAASEDLVYAVTFDGAGRLVVAGRTADYGGTNLSPSDGGFALARYLDDGSLDTTFGDGGRVITRFAMPAGAGGWVTWGSGSVGDLLATDADGSLLAVGWSSGGKLTLARYNPDGSLDATFGAGGIVQSLGNAASTALTWDAQLLPDGRLAVAGGGESDDVRAGLLDADGNILEMRSATVPPYDKARISGEALDGEGRLLVVGLSAPTSVQNYDYLAWWPTTDMSIWRYNTSFTGEFELPPGPPAPEPDPMPEPDPAPVPTDDSTEEFSDNDAPTPSDDVLTITSAPTIRVSVQGKSVVRSGRSYAFKALFESDTPIDLDLLGSMEVTGPNGFNATATVLKVKTARHGTRVMVTYSVEAPGGSFDAADNGAYAIHWTDGVTHPVNAALQPAGVPTPGEKPADELSTTSPLAGFEVAARPRRDRHK